MTEQDLCCLPWWECASTSSNSFQRLAFSPGVVTVKFVHTAHEATRTIQISLLRWFCKDCAGTSWPLPANIGAFRCLCCILIWKSVFKDGEYQATKLRPSLVDVTVPRFQELNYLGRKRTRKLDESDFILSQMKRYLLQKEMDVMPITDGSQAHFG